MTIKLRVHWECSSEGGIELPSGLFTLLQSIVDYGSLRAAAEECSMSYRHAWGMLQRWQIHFSCPLVDLKRGHRQGATLTKLGEKLLWEFKRINARIEPELASLASELSITLNNLATEGMDAILRVTASHGLVMASLRDLAKKTLDLTLDIQFQGSLDGLHDYHKGAYDIAGFHVPEGELGKPLLGRIRRFINPKTDKLVYAVRRQQGLMVASGNPQAISSLEDLLHEVTFINRQRNSGTRSTLDLLLQKSGLESDRIKGYDNEEFTHSAVAALVASGVVDCGFGIKAAAAQFNLDFIPLNWESYWFVFPKSQSEHLLLKQFTQLLASTEFKQKVAPLSGYDTSKSGRIVAPNHDLSVLVL